MNQLKRWLAAIVAAAAMHTAIHADDKKDEPKKAEEPKPAIDPKDVRVGPPPELAELRKAVEDAARKGENVEEIRKHLEALEKAVAGKAWTKPKPVDDPPPVTRPNPGEFPRPEPRRRPDALPENLIKAQELMLKAALLRAEDPAEAERLMKQARELLGANPGALLIPPRIDILPVPLPGRGSRLGVRVEAVPETMIERFSLPEDNGILAAEIVPDSPAEKAGLKAGDVIVEFAGKKVGVDPTAFVRTVTSLKPGEKVDIVFYRKGKKQDVKGVQLADLDNGRGLLDPRLDIPRAVPVPLPVPVPIAPLPDPRGGANKNVVVKIQNDEFRIHSTADGVDVVIAGKVDGMKWVPSKITLTEGRNKPVEAESVEKLPAEHRDLVQKILDEVKVTAGK